MTFSGDPLGNFTATLPIDGLADLDLDRLDAVGMAARVCVARLQSVVDAVTAEQLHRRTHRAGSGPGSSGALLTGAAVATRLGVSPSWVKRAANPGGPLARIVRGVGRARRFDGAALERWISREAP